MTTPPPSDARGVGDGVGDGLGDGDLQRRRCLECDGGDYDRATAWCRRTIAEGHDMMFAQGSFHREIAGASDRFGLSFEASLPARGARPHLAIV